MTMTIDHPLYPEFLVCLAGPAGINLHGDGSSDDAGPTDTSKTEAILRDLGFDDAALESSLAYFGARGGRNDREILMHTDRTADDDDEIRHVDEHDDALEHRHGHDEHEDAMRYLDEVEPV
jgi:hypothetical protein